MPMYDYKCTLCNHKFEELVFSSAIPDEEIKCPNCGENESQRLLCAPMVSTSSSANYSPAPSGGCNSSSGFT